MNARNIFISLVLLVGLIVLISPATFAQTTVFVDNTPGVGNDFNNGLTTATAKATIGSALSEFPSGTTIKVKGTGLTYNETVTLGAGINEKEYIIGTYDATAPIITGLVVNLTAANVGSFLNQVTFTGPFVVNNGLTLTAGAVLGAGNLTVKVAIIVTEGTVDANVVYSGTVDVTYNGANNRTTGGELGSATTVPQNITLALTVVKTLTLNANKTFSGTLTSNANSTLALGSNVLTLTGAVAHANTGAITASSTGGIIVDGTNGSMSFAGVGALPNITAVNGNTLTVSASTSIGSLIANPNSSITLSTAAAVTIDDATGTGKITNTGGGVINYTGAGGLLVKKDVEQSGTSTSATSARITFNGGIVTVNGNVVNSAVPVIANTTGALANIANIVFNANAHIIKGSVSLTGAGSVATTTGAVNNIKTVEFAAAGQVTRIDGGISNSCTLSLSKSTGSVTKSGSVLFTARAAGAVGAVAAGQSVAISNTSTITDGFDVAAQQNGAVDLNAAATGTFFGTNVSTSGAGGGYINLGAGALTISGDVTNSRTAVTAGGGAIVAPTGAVAVSIGGKLSNSGACGITLGGGAAVSIAGSLESIGTGTTTINVTGFSFSVTGLTTVSGGTVTLPLATSAATFAFTGGLTLSGGTLNIAGTGAITAPVSSGSLSLTGGTLAVGTGVRVWSSNALTHTIGGTTANTTITPNDATNATTFTLTTPAYAQIQTITFGPAVPVIPGGLLINVGTALPLPVVLKGGNVRVLNNVTFTAGVVTLDGTKLIIGQSLDAPIGNGSFINTAGYTTINNGAVSMNGGKNPVGGAPIVQVISGTGGGTYQFGSLEVDVNPAGGAAATPAAPITLQGNLYLTRGLFDNTNNITFNNSIIIPTIVVNAGVLQQAPLYGSGTTVNITYIGKDKNAAKEMEAGVSGKLNNLTIATTDGASLAGQGTVTIDGSVLSGTTVTVSGTLTITTGQALLLKGADLVLAGPSLVNNGLLANVAVGDQLQFGAAAGTNVTGNGWLPDVQVLAGSSGNIINGSRGLVTGFLGADMIQGGVADFDPATTEATGSLTFANGTAGLQVKFGTGALHGTNLVGITTAATGNTLKISTNLVEAGNVAHAAGTIQIDSAVIWRHRGVAPVFTGGALTTGLGTLMFNGNASTPVIFSAAGTDVTIASNVEVNLTNTADIFQLNPATAGHLIVSGDFTVTKGVVQLGSGTARNLTLTGTKLTLTSTGSINTTGVGTLRLNSAAPPLVWTFSGAVTVGNVRVSNAVTLNGSSSPSLTVTGTFLHDGGLFTFGDMDLTVSGGFTRATTAGGYSAGAGYLIVRNAAFNQGTGFSIPNLRFGVSPDNIAITFAGTGNVVVTKKLYLDNSSASTITHTVSSAPKLNVSDAADVYYSDGKLDVAPVYGPTINLHVVNVAGAPRTIDATVWPASAGLVQQLELKDAGFSAVLPDSRTVNKTLDLISGTLNVPTGKTLTVVDSVLITVDAGVLTGTVAYGNGISEQYVPSGAAYASNGVELPSTVNNLTFTRLGNTVNRTTTLNNPVTITGTLSIKNNLTTNAAITLNGDLIIAKDAFSNATIPTTSFNAALLLAGSANTKIIVSGSAVLSSLQISKATSTTTVTLSGGNLDMSAGIVTFTKGLLKTDSVSYIWINAGALAAQGFVRNVAPGDLSHVVGNVKKTLKAGTLQSFGRNEFPVGSMVAYCPVAITIVNSGGNISLGVNVMVNHSAVSPSGIVGLPIVNGVAPGVDISRYAGLSWGIVSDVSLGNTVFDLELTDPSFTSYDDIANVRIIRRIGTLADLANTWSLQGLVADYDNFVVAAGPTVVNHNSVGGIRPEGAIFTYGMKTNIVAPVIPDQVIGKVGGVYSPWKYALTGRFTNGVGTITYIASSTNPAVASVVVAHSGTTDTLKVTALSDGNTIITVKATDANNDFVTVAFNVRVQSVGVDAPIELPKEFSLNQNYPNPFNPTTNIKFGIPQNSSVKIAIYDMLGREVATLVNTNYTPGYYTVPFNASKLSSGMYIYRMTSQSLSGDQKMFTSTKKLMLLK